MPLLLLRPSLLPRLPIFFTSPRTLQLQLRRPTHVIPSISTRTLTSLLVRRETRPRSWEMIPDRQGTGVGGGQKRGMKVRSSVKKFCDGCKVRCVWLVFFISCGYNGSWDLMLEDLVLGFHFHLAFTLPPTKSENPLSILFSSLLYVVGLYTHTPSSLPPSYLSTVLLPPPPTPP